MSSRKGEPVEEAVVLPKHDLTVEEVLTPEARTMLANSEDGGCPLCGVVEPHRHCRNCYDKLDVTDEQGHMMQSGMFACSPAEPAEVRGAV